MRIVFITSKLNFFKSGGSVEEIDLLARTFVHEGATVELVTVFSKNNEYPASLPYRVYAADYSEADMNLYGYTKAFYCLLKQYSKRADIYVIDGHLGLYAAGLYKLFGGRVPVVSFFNSYLGCWKDSAPRLFTEPTVNYFSSLKSKIRWLLERYIGIPLANRIDLMAFVSPTLKKVYENFGIRHNETDLIIGDPIDFIRIRKEANITAESYVLRNKAHTPITIFYSSRMAPGKGFDLLLDGFSKITNKNDFRLILGGSGPQARLVSQMVENLHLQEYVELPGWTTKEQLYDYFKKTDIFIQVGWKPEGTSCTLLYAMTFGIPSILPEGGGLQWAADKCALYVKNGNAEQLARAIERLGGDPVLRESLSQQCHARLSSEEMNHAVQIPRLFRAINDLHLAYLNPPVKMRKLTKKL